MILKELGPENSIGETSFAIEFDHKFPGLSPLDTVLYKHSGQFGTGKIHSSVHMEEM